jgi:magnesium transporter
MAIQTLEHKRVTWTNITRATPDDVQMLREEYPHFHPLDLEDLLSRIERPKLDEYEDYLFIVMQFPIWDPVQRISRPSEVDIFIGSGYLVTVHDGTLKPLKDLFEQCQTDTTLRERLMGRTASRVFYTVIDRLVDYLFPILYKIDSNVRGIEERIFMPGKQRHALQELAFVRRDVLSLTRIVRPQVEIVTNLERQERPYIHDELEVYFGDILDHLHKASDLIADHMDIVVGLADTANTLANLQTNEIIQILTIISVIMMPLTLISGIYGMNVDLPLQNSPFAFIIIIALMFVIMLAMLYVFRRRKWI